MFNKLDIVARIDSSLKSKKITATSFATAMGGPEKGYSKDTVYTWKNNRSTSYMNDLQNIADYLGVSTDYLLTGEEPQTQDKGEIFLMDKEARLCLKELVEMFRTLKKWGDSAPLHEWGITPEGLREWCVSNFDTPPSKTQLKNMFAFYKKNESRILIDWDSIETTINDYAYHIETATESNTNAESTRQIETLGAVLQALLESTYKANNRADSLNSIPS